MTDLIGPAGPDGTGHRLLAANRAPLSDSGLDALDGTNDPWRWWPIVYDGWIGPAYSVTWLLGDVIPVLDAVTGSLFVKLVVAEGLSPGEVDNAPGLFSVGPSHQSSETTYTSPLDQAGPMTADADGSGVAFLIQAEVGNTHTAVPDPALDITTLLGDLTVGDPFVWGETGDGVDTDFWLNTGTGELYGPKTAGTWPPPGWVLPPA